MQLHARFLTAFVTIAAASLFGCDLAMQHGHGTKEHAGWGYEGDHGPSHWGGLDAANSLCDEGTDQSPIDLSMKTARKSDLSPLQIAYQKMPLAIQNNGHTIQVDSKPGGTLTIDKARYELLQLHFHAPSEHTIEGVHYPVEMHLVHKSSQGELAVLGVFFEEGDHHAALDSLTQNLPAQEGEAFEPEGVSIDVSDLLPETGSFYRYPGSLTTPPCSEGVLWTVLIDPVEISEEQCSGFTSALGRNNRPVQPLHEREVMVRE